MKKKHADFIAEAYEQALRSSHSAFRHGCVLVHRSKILASGFNTEQSHAERDCFRNLKVSKARKGGGFYIIYNIRLNASCESRLSRPCAQCAAYLLKQNVKTVFFTTNENTIEKWHLF